MGFGKPSTFGRSRFHFIFAHKGVIKTQIFSYDTYINSSHIQLHLIERLSCHKRDFFYFVVIGDAD